MYELLDKGFLDLLEGIDQRISGLFGSFIGIATTLAGIFALIYIGIESYKMILGEQRLDATKLFRPFLIGMVIMGWLPFLQIIDTPCKLLTRAAKETFEEKIEELDDLQRERAAVQDSILIAVVENDFQAQEAAEISNDDEVHKIGLRLDGIIDAVGALKVWAIAKLRMFFMNIIESIIIMLWQAAVYLIMFLGVLFKAMLAIIGPLSFAFSLLPSWRDTWSQWVSRYITVSLYGFIAYIELAISTMFMSYSVQSDTEVLEQVNADESLMALYTVFQSGYNNGFLPALIVSAIGLLLVPKVAEWIIPSSGTSMAASSAKRNVAAGVKAAAGVIG